jgi:hypothetical protein
MAVLSSERGYNVQPLTALQLADATYDAVHASMPKGLFSGSKGRAFRSFDVVELRVLVDNSAVLQGSCQ